VTRTYRGRTVLAERKEREGGWGAMLHTENLKYPIGRTARHHRQEADQAKIMIPNLVSGEDEEIVCNDFNVYPEECAHRGIVTARWRGGGPGKTAHCSAVSVVRQKGKAENWPGECCCVMRIRREIRKGGRKRTGRSPEGVVAS